MMKRQKKCISFYPHSNWMDVK